MGAGQAGRPLPGPREGPRKPVPAASPSRPNPHRNQAAAVARHAARVRIAPHDNDSHRLFVTHSLLIAIARLVAHGLTRDRGGLARRPRRRLRVLDLRLAPGPGMGWRAAPDRRGARLEAPPARRHAVLVHGVRVGPGPEGVGEYYTPDWLAALIVREALDETWRSRAIEQAETSARTSTRLDGVGVLDPTCGSRNLPLPRRPADP